MCYPPRMSGQKISWESSVARARQGNLQAVTGRMAIAKASFEQIGMFGEGTSNNGGRTLLTFADEAGIEYNSLGYYRSVTFWWYEADPVSLFDKMPAPDNLSWSAMIAGKRYFPVASDFKELLKTNAPFNGKTWTKPDILRLKYGRENPIEEESQKIRSPFESAMFSVPRMANRVRTLRAELAAMNLPEKDREALEAAIADTIEAMEDLRRVVVGERALAAA